MGVRGTEGMATEGKLHISETKPHGTKHLSSVVPCKTLLRSTERSIGCTLFSICVYNER